MLQIGHIETVKFLIEKGAVVHMKNKIGETPLHFAALNGNSIDIILKSTRVNLKLSPFYKQATQKL